uniref:Uncharacterized protein n=1 Tax=Oryza sativa subsp. japonica TaxID=39947 RepID=Q6Z4W5_ORYSJ|nr:hypothetical protein [Oryza sativa Japonica Group]BAC99733.1 hypothetical protein [Oryza sativa Japonica Group]
MAKLMVVVSLAAVVGVSDGGSASGGCSGDGKKRHGNGVDPLPDSGLPRREVERLNDNLRMLHERGTAPKLTRERGTDDVGRRPDLRKKERISLLAALQRDSLRRPYPRTLATLMAQRLGRRRARRNVFDPWKGSIDHVLMIRLWRSSPEKTYSGSNTFGKDEQNFLPIDMPFQPPCAVASAVADQRHHLPRLRKVELYPGRWFFCAKSNRRLAVIVNRSAAVAAVPPAAPFVVVRRHLRSPSSPFDSQLRGEARPPSVIRRRSPESRRRPSPSPFIAAIVVVSMCCRRITVVISLSDRFGSRRHCASHLAVAVPLPATAMLLLLVHAKSLPSHYHSHSLPSLCVVVAVPSS